MKPSVHRHSAALFSLFLICQPGAVNDMLNGRIHPSNLFPPDVETAPTVDAAAATTADVPAPMALDPLTDYLDAARAIHESA